MMFCLTILSAAAILSVIAYAMRLEENFISYSVRVFAFEYEKDLYFVEVIAMQRTGLILPVCEMRKDIYYSCEFSGTRDVCVRYREARVKEAHEAIKHFKDNERQKQRDIKEITKI